MSRKSWRLLCVLPWYLHKTMSFNPLSSMASDTGPSELCTSMWVYRYKKSMLRQWIMPGACILKCTGILLPYLASSLCWTLEAIYTYNRWVKNATLLLKLKALVLFISWANAIHMGSSLVSVEWGLAHKTTWGIGLCNYDPHLSLCIPKVCPQLGCILWCWLCS